MGNRLIVRGQTFTLPMGSGDRIRDQLAQARLSAAAPHPGGATAAASPFIQPGSALEEHWLSGALADDDPLIAWLPTISEHTFTESIGDKSNAVIRFLLTATSAALVAVSRFGEVHHVTLPSAPIVLSENRLSRDHAAIGEQRWRLPRGGLEHLKPLHTLPSMSRDRRLREAARLLSLREEAAGAAALLDAIAAPDALDALSLAVLGDDRPGQDAALIALTQSDSDAGRLVLWAREWSLPLKAAREMLGTTLKVLATTDAAWAIPLHRQVRDRQLANESDLFSQAEIDLQLAAIIVLGGAQEARQRQVCSHPAGALSHDRIVDVGAVASTGSRPTQHQP